MACLIEKQLPFSCHLPASSDFTQAGNNDLVFALLECLVEGINIQRQQDFGSDIERLEHKLNLVIFMMNNLVQPAHSRPAPRLLRLDTDSIAWQSDTAYQHGATLHITLFLHPMLPIPLQCAVCVEDYQDGWCHARLQGLSEDALASWSRWVFRQHRHLIAQTREQSKQPHN